MSFIVLSNGTELELRNPRPSDFSAIDIAWSLAQTNRFMGRANRPYSVAEHSLLVREIAERELGGKLMVQFAALLHDAHEAYCGDTVSPAKREIGPAWHEWESFWQRHVERHFAFSVAARINAPLVKRADLIALATERRDLMPQSSGAWPALEGIEPAPWVDLNAPERRAMSWADWRDRWLDEYQALDFARNDRLLGA
jgi:hypothetical protein